MSFGFNVDDHEKSTDLQAIKQLLKAHKVITPNLTRFILFDNIFPNGKSTCIRNMMKKCLPPWINTNEVTIIDIENSNKLDEIYIDSIPGFARSPDGVTSPVSHNVF